jgi:REP-associated tyrosine transposase
MGRRPREDIAGAIQHVFARGNNRRIVFRDDADRRLYLSLLACVVCDRLWRVLSYCLMPNHVHLVVETPEANLSLGMRDLHRDYTRAFNDRHDDVGHVFHKPFRNKRVEDDAHLETLIGYVVVNPVAAGLVQRPEEWAWGSDGALAAGFPPPCLDFHRLMDLLGADGGNPHERYRAIIEARLETLE